MGVNCITMFAYVLKNKVTTPNPCCFFDEQNVTLTLGLLPVLPVSWPWAFNPGGSAWSPGCWLRWAVASILVCSGSVQTIDSSRSPGNMPRATRQCQMKKIPFSRSGKPLWTAQHRSLYVKLSTLTSDFSMLNAKHLPLTINQILMSELTPLMWTPES